MDKQDRALCDANLARGLTLFGLIGICVSAGCASFKVVGDDAGKEGLTYYLPKPYILVTRNVTFGQLAPAPPKKKADKAADLPPAPNVTTPSYSMHLIYLPDLESGERRMKIKPNWGSAEIVASMANGWQLTSLNVKLNSKGAESLTGAAALLGAAAPAFTPTPATGTNNLDVLAALIGQIFPSATAGDQNLLASGLKSAFDKLLADSTEPEARLFEMKLGGAGIIFEEVKVTIGGAEQTDFFHK